MASTFKQLLIAEYPIPMVASVFSTTLPVETRVDMDTIIELALAECESYLELYCSVCAQGIETQLPDTAKAVTSVKLEVAFQGNRYVKWNYDNQSKVVTLRYFPAIIKYKKSVELADLNTLKGSRLIYIKALVTEKMLNKEIAYLTSIRLDPENGGVDVTALVAARQRCIDLLNNLGDDIAILSNG